jgi:hypothetical protein
MRDVTVSEPVDGESEWIVAGERIPNDLMPSTRGDVRRLLSALGLPLKENSNA